MTDRTKTAAHDRGSKPGGTNTQGGLAGIAEASRASEERLEAEQAEAIRAHEARETFEGERAAWVEPDPGAGTDQPPRMAGPLGADPRHPHLPVGAQSNEQKGSGAGGFDVGVDATVVGAPTQGARPEDPSKATQPD